METPFEGTLFRIPFRQPHHLEVSREVHGGDESESESEIDSDSEEAPAEFTQSCTTTSSRVSRL